MIIRWVSDVLSKMVKIVDWVPVSAMRAQARLRLRKLARGFLVIPGVLDSEGVGDALVGGLGPPVDAVDVDLGQDGDAVPGAAGDLGGGHFGVEPERDGGVAQVAGAAAW